MVMWNGKLLLLMLMAGLVCFVEGLSAQTRVAPLQPRVGVGKPLRPEVPDVLVTKSCVKREVSMVRICASGNCQEFKTSCFPYQCDWTTNICRETCLKDTDCMPPARCKPISTIMRQCVVPAWRCENEDVTDGIDVIVNCGPYRCKGGFCPGTCFSTGDCKQGYVCGADGHCVPP